MILRVILLLSLIFTFTAHATDEMAPIRGVPESLRETLNEVRLLRKKNLPDKQFKLSERIFKVFIENGMPDGNDAASIEKRRQLMSQVDATEFIPEIEAMLKVPEFKDSPFRVEHFMDIQKIITKARKEKFLSYDDMVFALARYLKSINLSDYTYDDAARYFGKVNLLPYFNINQATEISEEEISHQFVHFQGIHEIRIDKTMADGFERSAINFTVHDNNHVVIALYPITKDSTFSETLEKELLRNRIKIFLMENADSTYLTPYALFHEQIDHFSTFLHYIPKQHQDESMALLLKGELSSLKQYKNLEPVFEKAIGDLIASGGDVEISGVLKHLIHYRDTRRLIEDSPKILNEIRAVFKAGNEEKIFVFLRTVRSEESFNYLYEKMIKDPEIIKSAKLIFENPSKYNSTIFLPFFKDCHVLSHEDAWDYFKTGEYFKAANSVEYLKNPKARLAEDLLKSDLQGSLFRDPEVRSRALELFETDNISAHLFAQKVIFQELTREEAKLILEKQYAKKYFNKSIRYLSRSGEWVRFDERLEQLTRSPKIPCALVEMNKKLLK